MTMNIKMQILKTFKENSLIIVKDLEQKGTVMIYKHPLNPKEKLKNITVGKLDRILQERETMLTEGLWI